MPIIVISMVNAPVLFSVGRNYTMAHLMPLRVGVFIPLVTAYLKIASNVQTNMGLAATALAESTVLAHASKAKGSLREFVSSVVIDGLRAGGIVPV